MNTPTLLDPATVAAELIGGQPAPATPAAPNVASSDAGSGVGRGDPGPSAGNGATVPATPTPDGMIDRAGRVFDAARYKSNPDKTPFRNKNGYFMPKGGRNARGSASASPTATAPAPVSAPAVTAPPPALPTSAAPAWTEAEKAAAAAPAPEAAAPGSAAVPVETAPAVDYSADAGKAISAGVFVLAGVVFGAREETTPPKTEAGHLTDATAAWIRSTGWRGGPLAGMLLAWTAYFLGLAEKPKVGARLREWFGVAPKTPKPVAAVDVQATPVPAAAPVASAPNPAPASPRDPFAAPSGFGAEKY